MHDGESIRGLTAIILHEAKTESNRMPLELSLRAKRSANSAALCAGGAAGGADGAAMEVNATLFDVGGRSLYRADVGTGTPTVGLAFVEAFVATGDEFLPEGFCIRTSLNDAPSRCEAAEGSERRRQRRWRRQALT